jgi:hypothetical protein
MATESDALGPRIGANTESVVTVEELTQELAQEVHITTAEELVREVHIITAEEKLAQELAQEVHAPTAEGLAQEVDITTAEHPAQELPNVESTVATEREPTTTSGDDHALPEETKPPSPTEDNKPSSLTEETVGSTDPAQESSQPKDDAWKKVPYVNPERVKTGGAQRVRSYRYLS